MLGTCPCTAAPPLATGTLHSTAITENQRTMSKIRFICGVPDIPLLDANYRTVASAPNGGAFEVLYLNNRKWVSITDNLTYMEIGPLMRIPPTRHEFAIVFKDANGQSVVAKAFNSTLIRGVAYNYIIHGSYRDGTMDVLPMSAAVECEPNGKSAMRFVHAAPISAVGVYDRADADTATGVTQARAGGMIFENVSYGVFVPHGPYLSTDPGALSLLITQSNNPTNIYLAPPALPLEGGGRYSIILVGGGKYPLQTIHSKDNSSSCIVSSQ